MEHDHSQHERRTFSRVQSSGKVAIMGERSYWMAALIDISMKGVLLVRPEEWPDQPGKNYQLKIQLADSELMVTMDASLAHSSDEFLGFCCEHIDLDSITHLRRLLEHNIDDDERINHELSALIFMHNNRSG